MGRIENPDGTITYTNSKPSRVSKEQPIRNGKSVTYAICGAENRAGGTCGAPAGAGTDHKGKGRCFMHGGRKQHDGIGQLKENYSLTRMITYPGIQEEVKRLSEERDVFDLREHIFLMEAISTTILNKAKTMEDLGMVLQYVEKCAKVIQKLDEIEHGRRLVIDIQGLNVIFAKITEVIHRYVPDSYTRELLGQGLNAIAIGGPSVQDFAFPEPGAIVEGVAVEVGPGVGTED
jgi:hypothetical protein